MERKLYLLEPGLPPKEIHLKNVRIIKVALGDRMIYVNGKSGEQLALYALDRETGQVLTEIPAPAYHCLQVTGGRVVGVILEKQGKPMIHVRDPDNLETRETFFKPTPRILTMVDNAGLWLVHKRGAYAMMSEVSKRIYFASPSRIDWERDHSDALPNTYPYKIGDLGPHFISPTRRSTQAPLTANQTKGLTDFYRHWQSQSRVVYFGALGDGYVVCFEIPDQIDGFYVGNHLGIRFLNRRFQPLGPVQERYGQAAGAAGGALYVVYPDGREPLPSSPGAMTEHYGLDRLESLTALYRHWKKYRFQENRGYHIIAEALKPEVGFASIE
ncbi:MAG: hypothetical protein QNK37_02445 [Acidobacteriota bacterium]|nr:hypothetical protein [Acidobacteriota bacterium]